MRHLLIIPALAIALFLSACGSSQPRNCWKTPARYGGWVCAGEGEGQGSYVNPGSGEYEAE